MKDAPPRFGFTVTKQFGGAVQRNLIRRRLKEALRLLKPLPARPGHDYVILARPEALDDVLLDLAGGTHASARKDRYRQKPPPIRQDHRRNDTRLRWRGRGTPKEFKRQDTQGMTKETKNIILATCLSILVVLGWETFYAGPQLEKERQRQAQMHQRRDASGAQTTGPRRAIPQSATGSGVPAQGGESEPQKTRADALAESPED